VFLPLHHSNPSLHHISRHLGLLPGETSAKLCGHILELVSIPHHLFSSPPRVSLGLNLCLRTHDPILRLLIPTATRGDLHSRYKSYSLDPPLDLRIPTETGQLFQHPGTKTDNFRVVFELRGIRDPIPDPLFDSRGYIAKYRRALSLGLVFTL